MNLVFSPDLTQVPEWKQCYFDYSLLDHLLAKLKKSLHLLLRLKKNDHTHVPPLSASTHTTNIQKLNTLVDTQLQTFYLSCSLESIAFSHFVQYKIYEIQTKFIEYVQLIDTLKMTSNQILILLQNLYIEAYYLHHSIEYNISKRNQIINKLHHIQHSNSTVLTESQKSTPNTFSDPRLNRINQHSKTLKQNLQQTYTSYCIFNNRSWSHITSLSSQKYQQKNQKKVHPSLVIGFTMGCFLAFICILIMVNVVNKIGIEKNAIFTNNFPVWRGASQAIFYIWILGLNVWCFQKTQINYKLIFFTEEGYNLPNSKFYFELASVFSLGYLIMLMVFMLELIGTIHNNFIYYGQIFWLVFIVYLIQPLPILHHKGRFYIIKMVGRILFSPFFPMSFMTIWISQQIVSLTQPITDLFYTIFFFANRNITITKLVVANFNSGLVIAVFVYRMGQNLKFWYQNTQARADKKYDFMAPPFLGFVRASFGCLTAICGMVYRLKLFPNAFTLWLVVIIISTLVAWYVDVRGDWGQLLHENRTLLRPKLLFPKYRKMYIFIIVINFGLRAAWGLTISPFFVNSTGVLGVLWVMFLSFIEIFRRGIWNILRIQNQHVRNCEKYQATVADQYIFKKAKQQAQKIKNKRKNSENKMPPGSSMRIISDFYLDFDNHLANQANQAQKKIDFRKLRIEKQLEVFKDSLLRRDQIRSKVIEKIKNSKELLGKLKGTVIFTNFCGRSKIR